MRAKECHRMSNTSSPASDSPDAPDKRHPDKRYGRRRREKEVSRLSSMKGPSLTISLLLLLLLLIPDLGAVVLLQPSATCCTQLYRQPLSKKLLRRVTRVELQEADGDCHLQAFILHLSQRSVCIHPQNRSLARWFERQGRRPQGTLPNLNFELIRKMGQDPQQPKE
ncbi:PREDICTED: C-C motif chemokine 27 [Miniopterus natalensis]|uniref:C-C motif chemokine 27 n=1 Tax=Miniopterus natalensis TaxID=291302 RepID=UPI0007A701D3|nr:PREDICTED: C-C motif chemokine 27 [Miniopterus natalensis]